MTDALLLMRLYWRLDSRDVRAGRTSRLLSLGLRSIFVLIIAAFSGILGYGAAALVTEPSIPIQVDPSLIPGVLLTIVMVGVLVAGLGQAIKALFLSGDLDRLMAAPVNTRSVMVAKLLSRLPWNVIFLLLIAGPALFAFGYGTSAGPVYYLAGLILLLMAPMFGLSLGALLAMVLVRILPAERLNELLAAAYAVMGILIGLAFQLPRFLNSDSLPQEQTLQSVEASLSNLQQLPLPTLAAGQGLLALDQGRITEGLGGIIGYVFLTLGLFIVTILVSDRLYLSGWLRTQGTATKRASLSEGGGVFSGNSLAMALMVKDWLLRLRDPRQLVSIFGGGIFFLVIGGLTLFRGNQGQLSLIEITQTTSLSGFPGSSGLEAILSPGLAVAAWATLAAYVIFSTAASSSLAQEHQAFYTLKAAPVTPLQVWYAKTTSVFIPFLAFAVILLLAGWIPAGYHLVWLPYALICMASLGYGLLATNTSVGFQYANLDWEDPRRMTTRNGSIVSLALSIVYGLAALVLIMLPFVLASVWSSTAFPIAIAGLAGLGLFTWIWTRWQGRRAEKGWYALGDNNG